MNCSSAIDRMLEADPHELLGEGRSVLAGHIGACERCRVLAEQIVSSQLELARDLDMQAPRIRADEALKAAERREVAINRRNAIWQIGAPLAAAAGIMGIVFAGNGGIGMNGIDLVSSSETFPGLEVQGPPGKDVAVFEVADRPDVVVVWFFDAGDD